MGGWVGVLTAKGKELLRTRKAQHGDTRTAATAAAAAARSSCWVLDDMALTRRVFGCNTGIGCYIWAPKGYISHSLVFFALAAMPELVAIPVFPRG